MRYLKPRKRVFHLRGDGPDPLSGASIEGVLYGTTRADYIVLDATVRESEDRSIPVGHIEIPRDRVLYKQVTG